MPESNEPQGQSPEPSGQIPDFRQDLYRAQATGDFARVIDTARKSFKMLVDFRDTIAAANYQGRNAVHIAQGLNFLDNMISQASAQLNALKMTEKQTREALKQAEVGKNGATPIPEPPAPEAA